MVYQQKIESLNNFPLYDRAARVCCNDLISKHGEHCRKLLLFKANSEPFHQTVSKQIDRLTILSLTRLEGVYGTDTKNHHKYNYCNLNPKTRACNIDCHKRCECLHGAIIAFTTYHFTQAVSDELLTHQSAA